MIRAGRAAFLRTAKACGSGTRGWCQIGGGFREAQPGSQSRQFADDGGKRNSSPGRARHKPSNHCAGKAGCSPLDLYARVRTSLCHCTRDRGCSAHPVFPAPSHFRGQAARYNSGASRRGNALAYPHPRPDTISADNHPELSPVATFSSGGIFRRLPRGRRQARKKAGRRNANGERFDHQGQSLHCRDLRASDPARTR